MPSGDQHKRSGRKIFVIPADLGKHLFQSPGNPGGAILDRQVFIVTCYMDDFPPGKNYPFPTLPRILEGRENYFRIISKRNPPATKPLIHPDADSLIPSLVAPATSVRSSKCATRSDFPAYIQEAPPVLGAGDVDLTGPSQYCC